MTLEKKDENEKLTFDVFCFASGRRLRGEPDL